MTPISPPPGFERTSSALAGAIGGVMMQAAHLEYQLNLQIHYLKFHPGAGGMKEATTFNKKLKRLGELVRVGLPNCPTVLSRIDEVAKQAPRLWTQRNWVAHAWWLDMGGNGQNVLVVQGKKKMLYAYEAHPSELRELAGELKRVHDSLVLVFLGFGTIENGLPEQEREALRAFSAQHIPQPVPGLDIQNKPPMTSFRKA